MSDSIVEAKYQIVPERTLPVIASEIRQIERTVYGVAMDGAIQIGEKLKEAQAMTPAGEWVKWLSENLNYSQRQAYNFMEIASNYGDKHSPFYNLQTSANLSISKALELLRLPDEEVETFAENTDIEGSTVKDLRDEIRRLKQEKEAAEAKADAASLELLSGDEQEIADLQHSVEHLNNQLKDSKEKLKKLKEKNKELEASKEEEIRKKVEEVNAEMKEKAKTEAFAEVEATLKENEEDITRLGNTIETLEKKLANSSNESLVEFKVLCDQLQDTYFRINDIITDQNQIDEEVGGKMQAALQKIVEGWRP